MISSTFDEAHKSVFLSLILALCLRLFRGCFTRQGWGVQFVVLVKVLVGLLFVHL